MVYAHNEDFTDSIDAYGTTYMWQICSKIFIYNTTESFTGQIDTPCRNWFLDALERCSEMVFLRPEPKVHTWLFHQMMNLRFFIFPRTRETSVANSSPHARMQPDMLTKSDCNQLFVEAAKDYIEIAPRYSICVEDNLHYVAFLKTLFGLFTAYLILVFIKKLFSKKWWRLSRSQSTKPTTLTLQQISLFKKLRWFSKRSLATHKYEVNHFKVEKTNVERLYCDPPTIAIKVKKKQLSDVLCSLVQTDPVFDEQRNGFTRSRTTKSRGYALHKLNLFLNTKSHCRVIIDIGFDENESDSDVEQTHLQKIHSLSAGDQPNLLTRRKESTLDESGDTSSLSSYKVNRPRRYCSKHKSLHMYSSSFASSIPSPEKYKESLNRKESSNSVAILHRRDSRLMFRRSYDAQRNPQYFGEIPSCCNIPRFRSTEI